MNSIRNLLVGTALAAGALLSAGAVLSLASAADTPTTAPTTPPAYGRYGWHHHDHHVFWQQLNLTDPQKASIKTIMQTNGPQLKSLHEQLHVNSLKLRQTQPDDPNYSNVVSQTASANAAVYQQIDTLKAQIRQEIYFKLTPAQRTQLQTLKAQAEARRAAHAAGATPPTT